MNRRILGIVAVVVLVATAGCAGVLDSGEGAGDGGNGTNGPQSLDEVTYPDGAAEDGFSNATALTESHRTTLGETNYALELNQTVVQDNQTTSSVVTIRSNNDSKRMVSSTSQTVEGSDGTRELSNEVYRNATHQHTNTSFGSSSSVQVSEARTSFGQSHESQTNARLVRSLLNFGNYSATDVVQRDGTTLIEYELDEYNSSAQGDFQPESVSGTVYVSQSGVVHELQISAEGTTQGRQVSLDLHYQVTETGEVTVEPPAWVDSA